MCFLPYSYLRPVHPAELALRSPVTRLLLESSLNNVFASCRSPTTALDLAALKSSPEILHIIQIDVIDEINIKAGPGWLFKSY
jgi:hypothetical protein